MKLSLLGAVLAAAVAALGQVSAGPTRGPQPDAQDFLFLADSRPVLVRVQVRIDGKPLRAAWDDAMRRLFAHLDTNGDGVLDRKEVERAPPPQVLFHLDSVGSASVPSLALLDTDRDGKVSPPELADYYRRNGGAAFQFPPTQDTQAELRLARLRAKMGQTRQANALNEALFKRLDSNQDGKLSRAELAAGPALLRELDADDDEMISAGELLPNVSSFGFTEKEQRFDMASASAPPTFLPLRAGESPKLVARQLQRRYGGGPAAQAGTKLTRKAIGLDQATFARLDVDGDGTLDTEELARFARRPADLEFTVDFRTGAERPLVGLLPAKDRATALAVGVHVAGDGVVRLNLASTQLALRCRPAESAAQFGARVRTEYFRSFLALDRDGNGYLDREEAQRSPRFRDLFALLDRDGDGKVFPKEVQAYLDAVRALQIRAYATSASVTFAQEGRGLFDLLDTNRDGRLSVRELRELTKLVDRLDRDADGHVSRNEIPHTHQVVIGQGPAGFNRERTPVGNSAVGSSGPRWFRKMDRNGDGDLSRREFLGTDEEFRRFDLDGDGLLSAEEAERADALLRKKDHAHPGGR